MANNTGLDEADVEPRRPSNPSLPKRNRSLVTPPVKFRILKIHAAETRPGKRPPRWEAPDFPRQRPAHCPLTLGNVGGSPTPGNHTAETALVGWGGRIRTSAFLKSICLNYRTNFGPFRENWPPETPLRSCERQTCAPRFEVTLCQGCGIRTTMQFGPVSEPGGTPTVRLPRWPAAPASMKRSSFRTGRRHFGDDSRQPVDRTRRGEPVESPFLGVVRCLVLAAHGDVAIRRRLRLLRTNKNRRNMTIGLPGLLH